MDQVMTDAQAAELISRSLDGGLSSAEQQELDRYLAQSDDRRRSASETFARLSRTIKEMAAGESDDANEDRLSEVSKERMRRSLRAASSLQSRAGQLPRDMVAESRTTYFSRTGEEQDGQELVPQAPEQRHATCRFTLLNKIGEGGLGVVWLARDEVLKRNVALKEMTPQAANSPRLWRRFQREAEITGHLEHPNVVPLYMSGVNPDSGLPFYAMRFLGKQTLLEAIREYHAKVASEVAEAVDLHRLLNIFLRVCQAIAYAHSRGVIHRDLKPENVVLDSFGQVIVLDWGLAKMEDDGELSVRISLNSDSADFNLGETVDGDIVGTPIYMAPEQAAGDAEAVDARTDVYGLGTVLFSILTGVAPHAKSQPKDSGPVEVQQFLDGIANSEPPRASDINVDAPSELDAICARAMAKEKYARQASALELADAVECWIAGTHKKEAQYDALRMAGRDLRSRLCVQARQLKAITQFMVELPPVQGLLESVDEDTTEFMTWRGRLSTILLSLTRVKPNLSGTSFTRILNDRAIELVRVERSLTDSGNIRSVPQSRLRDTVASQFQLAVMQLLPGEAIMDFDCTTAGAVRVLCGVPVFDANSEEPFGQIVSEAEIGNLVRPELEAMDESPDALLADDSGNIIFATSKDQAIKHRTIDELVPNWPAIKSKLKDEPDYIDPNRDVFATKLSLRRNRNSIHIIFTNHGR